MKRILFVLTVLLSTFLVQRSYSQKIDKVWIEKPDKNPFDKKFKLGVSFNSYWSSFKGSNLPKKYFYKPSIGGTIRAEYYVKPFIGIAGGIGFQQGGAGIINKDNSGGAFSHPWIMNRYGSRGDPDSTHLERIRFSSIELPLTIVLRTPKNVYKDFRLSGGAGIIFIRNFQQNDAWLSVVDGFHHYHFVSDYVKNDVGFQLSIGTDINAGDAGNLLQIHFVYQQGFKNVYAAGQGNGREVNCGLRFAWLF